MIDSHSSAHCKLKKYIQGYNWCNIISWYFLSKSFMYSTQKTKKGNTCCSAQYIFDSMHSLTYMGR